MDYVFKIYVFINEIKIINIIYFTLTSFGLSRKRILLSMVDFFLPFDLCFFRCLRDFFPSFGILKINKNIYNFYNF